jgi:hypothetical protein
VTALSCVVVEVALGVGVLPGWRGQAGSTIHVSKSLNGPWEPLTTNTLPGCNNPAPFVHTNGSIFIICNGFSLYRADTIEGVCVQRLAFGDDAV